MPAAVPRYPVVLSIAAALITIGMKTTSYLLTGSVGLLSDAAESLVNLLAAITAYLSLVVRGPAGRRDAHLRAREDRVLLQRPGRHADRRRGGRHRLVRVARLITPQPLQALGIGTIVPSAASVINLGVALVLLRVGRGRIIPSSSKRTAST